MCCVSVWLAPYLRQPSVPPLPIVAHPWLRLRKSPRLREGILAVLLNIGDFDPDSKTLRILGKGRGTQTEVIDLGNGTTEALAKRLEESRGTRPDDAPLFISLDFANSGHRLTGDGIRKIVVKLCTKAGIKKTMSPHRIRHSAITAALDATDGNVRKVQKLSRHRQLDTLMIYDDNRGKDQAEVSTLLDEMVF